MAADHYVITSRELGVFLGLVQQPLQGDVGLWSKRHRSNWVPLAAVAFATREQAYEFAGRFTPPPLGLELLEVEADMTSPDGLPFASREACVKAGAQSWIDTSSPTYNEIPC